jgi:DNA repair photolyase
MNANQISFFDQPAETAKAARPKNCTLIYTPKGRAREYSPLACNPYRGCGHECSYCFAPSATRKSPSEFYQPSLRAPSFLRILEKEAAKYEAAGITDRVLLSFTCDPYQPLDVQEQMTRKTIKILHSHGLPVQILTKGGSRALRDLDLLSSRDAFAATLTFLDETESLKWEPNAALPADRIRTLLAFHNAGVPTWVSLEPVIDPAAALAIIERTHSFVDLFKVGKLNYHPRAKEIDWRTFALDAMELLRSLGYRQIAADETLEAGEKGFYIKRDLLAFLG